MKIGKKSMPINRLILIIDDNRCQLIDWYRQSMTIDANRWQSIITHTWTIDCSSIININRLIGIDCHRMPSILIDHRFHRLGTPCPNHQCPDEVQCPDSLTDKISKISYPGLWNCIFPFLTWWYKTKDPNSRNDIY